MFFLVKHLTGSFHECDFIGIVSAESNEEAYKKIGLKPRYLVNFPMQLVDQDGKLFSVEPIKMLSSPVDLHN